MSDFVRVSKKTFYDYVNPRDIVVKSFERETLWKTRSGDLIGRSEGYSLTEPEEKFYELRQDLLWEEVNGSN